MKESLIVPATLDHVKAMAPHMKAADKAELQAWGSLEPEQALRDSLEQSLYAWTWIYKDKPLFMFGIAMNSFLSGTFTPWALGTDEACKYPKLFWRGSKKIVAQLIQDFPHMENWVDADHQSAIRWIKRMGFTIHSPEPVGVNGHLFHRFEVSS